MKRKESQLSKVKKYLEMGNSITPLDALQMFGCFRLAAIICILRQDKYWMHDKEIKTRIVKNNFGVKFASYKIDWYEKRFINELEMKKMLKYNNMKALGQVK